MALPQSAVSELLEAFRSGEGVDLMRGRGDRADRCGPVRTHRVAEHGSQRCPTAAAGHPGWRRLAAREPAVDARLVAPWCIPSGHRKRVSQDMGNRVGPVRLTGDESQIDHHSGCHRRSYPGRGRRRVRRLEGLGQQAGGPLPGRGGGSVRATVSAPRQKPNRASRGHRATDHRAAREAHRRGPGRRTGHHRLAPDRGTTPWWCRWPPSAAT
jgi:hypothetical protein